MPVLMPHIFKSLLPLAFLTLLTACAGGPAGRAYDGPTSLPEIRAKNGLSPLSADTALQRAAAEQAAAMAKSGSMNHTTRSGGTFATRMARVETKGGAAENIAHGRFGTGEIFQRWMNSPPHRRNMLNPNFTRYGLASADDPKGGGRKYWALVLAR